MNPLRNNYHQPMNMRARYDKKTELIGITADSDPFEILKKLTKSLEAQGIKVIDDLNESSGQAKTTDETHEEETSSDKK